MSSYLFGRGSEPTFRSFPLGGPCVRCAVISSVVREHSGPQGQIPAVLCRRGLASPVLVRDLCPAASVLGRHLRWSDPYGVSGAGCRGSPDRTSRPPFRGGTLRRLARLSSGSRLGGALCGLPRPRLVLAVSVGGRVVVGGGSTPWTGNPTPQTPRVRP